MKLIAQIIGRLMRVLLNKEILSEEEINWICSGDDEELHKLLVKWRAEKVNIRSCNTCKHSSGLSYLNGKLENTGACVDCTYKSNWENKE